jgi:hypothetical protein
MLASACASGCLGLTGVGDYVIGDPPGGDAGDASTAGDATTSTFDGGFVDATPTTSDAAVGDGPTGDGASCPADAGPDFCSPFTQCGCASGQVCIVEYTMFSCGPPGALADGEACTLSGCLAGSGCVPFILPSASLPLTVPGVCERWCHGDADCPSGAGWSCVQLDSEAFGSCLKSCDPLSPTSCSAGQSCMFADATHTACVATSNRADGASCSDDDLACAPTLVCDHDGASGAATCRPLCDTGASLPCPAGRSCVRDADFLVAYGSKTIGICR